MNETTKKYADGMTVTLQDGVKMTDRIDDGGAWAVSVAQEVQRVRREFPQRMHRRMRAFAFRGWESGKVRFTLALDL